jgi:hypothetical protein
MIMARSRGTPRSRPVAAVLAVLLGVGVLGGAAVPAAAWAATAPLSPAITAVQYNYSISFTSGQTSASKTITPVTPSNMVLVIQNISIYRYPASKSTLQTFLGINGGYIALPDITGTGDYYPAGTANLTGYVPAGQSAYVNTYRTGSPLNAESAYITVTGYLTAN